MKDFQKIEKQEKRINWDIYNEYEFLFRSIYVINPIPADGGGVQIPVWSQQGLTITEYHRGIKLI